MKKKQASDEIDLLEFFITIMNNKMKIILIAILTIAIVFSFKIGEENNNKDNQTKITTRLKAISLLEETQQNYLDLELYVDSIDIELNRFTLFDLFIKILDAEKKELVRNFNFIKKENYENEEAYNIAIYEIVSSIEIVQLKGKKTTEATIKFFSKNEDMSNKWGNFLKTLEYSINKKTQKYLRDLISNKIKNAKVLQNNAIEDIEKEIKAAVRYYELEIKSNLSFLEEQSKIAREGNISGKEISDNGFASNKSINYDKSLYYLKGYSVIEKEIELIKERKNPYLFARNIPLLEERKLEIENNQSIDRLKTRFEATPIFNTNSFSAGSIESTSTQLIKNNSDISTKKMIILASLIGLIIGVFYVTITQSIRKAMIGDPRFK